MRQQLLSQSVRGTRHRHERHLHRTASALKPSRLCYLAGRCTHLLDAAHVIAVELAWEHLHALLHRESARQRSAIHLTAQQAVRVSTRCKVSQSKDREQWAVRLTMPWSSAMTADGSATRMMNDISTTCTHDMLISS